MNKGLLKHMVVLARFQSAIQMRDKISDQDLDKLSMYDQDDLRLSIFVVGERLGVVEFAYRFLPVVSECQ
jgi:hypothetical protein